MNFLNDIIITYFEIDLFKNLSNNDTILYFQNMRSHWRQFSWLHKLCTLFSEPMLKFMSCVFFTLTPLTFNPGYATKWENLPWFWSESPWMPSKRIALIVFLWLGTLANIVAVVGWLPICCLKSYRNSTYGAPITCAPQWGAWKWDPKPILP